jgi:hypothetical protein
MQQDVTYAVWEPHKHVPTYYGKDPDAAFKIFLAVTEAHTRTDDEPITLAEVERKKVKALAVLHRGHVVCTMFGMPLTEWLDRGGPKPHKNIVLRRH